MLEATLSERAKTVLTAASGRSDVPPFMVMDVMAAAARIEAAGGHVIHMEVGEKDVDPSGRRRDLRAQSTDAGASVERQHGAVFRTHFDYWSVSPVTGCLGSGCRN